MKIYNQFKNTITGLVVVFLLLVGFSITYIAFINLIGEKELAIHASIVADLIIIVGVLYDAAYSQRKGKNPESSDLTPKGYTTTQPPYRNVEEKRQDCIVEETQKVVTMQGMM